MYPIEEREQMFFIKKHLPPESLGPTFPPSPGSSEVRIHGWQGGSSETAAHTALYHFRAIAGHGVPAFA